MKLRSSFYAVLGFLVFSASPLISQQSSLPDAPKPINNSPAAVEKRKWSDVVEPGEKVAPLYVKDKLLFPLHEEMRITSWFPTFFSAGWEQLRDTDPRYGVDSGAFGQRLGAAAVRDLSMRVFADGLLPAALHEDPRYYRMAKGPILRRGWYAASRTVIGPHDSGHYGFNTSVVLGQGMASALTMAYYPDKSANGRVVMETWGFSLLGSAGGNLWSEFWPDVRQKIFHPHRSDKP